MKTASDRIVEMLQSVHPDTKVKGFRQAIKKHVPRLLAEGVDVGFLPDAYRILPETKEVHLFEVVETNPIDSGKANRIFLFGDAMEDYEWFVTVVVFDWTGHKLAEMPYSAFSGLYASFFTDKNVKDALPVARLVLAELEGPEPTSAELLADVNRICL